MAWGREYDVIVVGAGFAGIMAAAVASGYGARTALVSLGPGSFALGSACLSFGELLSTGEKGVRAKWAEKGILEKALHAFKEISAAAGYDYKGAIDNAICLLTATGNFQEVHLAPISLASISKGKGNRRGLVVGIRQLADFDANFIAEALANEAKCRGLSAEYYACVVELPQVPREKLMGALEISRYIGDRGFRDRFISMLRNIKGDAEEIILPGVLGLDWGTREFKELEEEVGCTVGEIPTLPPSVPGVRVFRCLINYLKRKGVHLYMGFPAQDLVLEKNRCVGITVRVPGKKLFIKGQVTILATGKSGLAESDTLLGIPLDKSKRVYANEDLQLLSIEGNLVSRNILVAGSLLGDEGEKSGNAGALLTGYYAGSLAAGGM
ncbi:MAG: FAD-binding protein [Moorellaceae bacterium]